MSVKVFLSRKSQRVSEEYDEAPGLVSSLSRWNDTIHLNKRTNEV